MKRNRWVPLIVALFFVPAIFFHLGIPGGTVLAAPKEVKVKNSPPGGCKACHKDPTSLVPKKHPTVKGTDIASCIACHKPDLSGKAATNKFSSRIHLAHNRPTRTTDCVTCHDWKSGERFGLNGTKISWGRPAEEDMVAMKNIMRSWAAGTYMDALHAKGQVTCSGCHGAIPKLDDTLDNARCLSCHGPMDQLAARSAPKDFPDRNPHKSHLGEIHCTVCHKAHEPSKTYCLDCHRQFQMKPIPGRKTD